MVGTRSFIFGTKRPFSRGKFAVSFREMMQIEIQTANQKKTIDNHGLFKSLGWVNFFEKSLSFPTLVYAKFKVRSALCTAWHPPSRYPPGFLETSGRAPSFFQHALKQHQDPQNKKWPFKNDPSEHKCATPKMTQNELWSIQRWFLIKRYPFGTSELHVLQPYPSWTIWFWRVPRAWKWSVPGTRATSTWPSGVQFSSGRSTKGSLCFPMRK